MKKYLLLLLLIFPQITHACLGLETGFVDIAFMLFIMIFGIIICYFIAKMYYYIVKKIINLLKITETKLIKYSKWVVFILLSLNYIISLIIYEFSALC